MLEPNGPLSDDACSHFVYWLTAKTLEGRLRWKKHPNGLISQLPGSTFAQFITQTSERGQSWRLFRIRDCSGELLRATPANSGIETPTLALAVEALFATVSRVGAHFIH
jgi:hypothetical protein